MLTVVEEEVMLTVENEERVTVYADHTVAYHISTQEEVLLEW